ncbi:N-acetylmuramoyl-L-alanine amidase [Bacillus salitolerans]|uniref:Autolysin n=1 Tax=Bacillus salitolerans TaxID=1437434 RepID=A0ABW4LKG5_9BACI
MEIIDKRNELPSHPTKTYRRRALSAIKNIAIHHSATTSGSAESFARYHVNELDWPGIGYHFVIDKDGDIIQCHDLEVISYHVGNSNSRALGICMVGDFRTQQLTDPQRKATLNLILDLVDQLEHVGINDVWGHQEFPGYEWKPCPSVNMENIRAELLSIQKGGSPIYYRSPSYISGRRKRTYLSIGDQGDDVLALQERLTELNFKPGDVDGIFGKITEDSVKRFQRAASLNIDGVVGPLTREALKSYEAVSNIELASPTDEADDQESMYEMESRRLLRLLRPYMRGDDIRNIQQKVGAVEDGIYGPSTAELVREFQRKNNLVSDGIVGPRTWQALDRTSTRGVPYSRLLFLNNPYMQGRDVKRIQEALTITADGIYGPLTDQAVKSFQRRERLNVDGIVGERTWNRLFQA